MTVYYCYDAYCGWCYGFSPVIRRIYEEYRHTLAFEVLSGGMILPEKPRHIGVMADYIRGAYKVVEERTGVPFGADWLWHINNPDESDWYPNSEKPAIALCVFKDYYPDEAVLFAGELQYALHYEGRDLTDDEAYRHLVEKYRIPEKDFYGKLHHPAYKEKAHDEFALVRHLKVNGFPTVFLQVSQSKFYLLTRGYSDYETVKKAISDAALQGK